MPSQAACGVIESLWSAGYSGLDVVGTLFRLVKFEDMDEGMKLDFVKASMSNLLACYSPRVHSF